MNDSLTGSQTLFWDNNGLESMRVDQSDEQFNYGTNQIRVGGNIWYNSIVNGVHYVSFPYYWINTVTYDYDSVGFHFNLDRGTTYTSRLLIDNEYIER